MANSLLAHFLLTFVCSSGRQALDPLCFGENIVAAIFKDPRFVEDLIITNLEVVVE